jgi:hypothetical protein
MFAEVIFHKLLEGLIVLCVCFAWCVHTHHHTADSLGFRHLITVFNPALSLYIRFFMYAGPVGNVCRLPAGHYEPTATTVMC